MTFFEFIDKNPGTSVGLMVCLTISELARILFGTCDESD